MKTNPANTPIIEIGEANFESEVSKSSTPVLAVFNPTETES
jgi:hypothetical protein